MENANWLTITPSSGTGATAVSVTASKNETDVSRQAVIIITAGDISKKIKVKQNGKQISDYTLVINYDKTDFKNTGDTFTYTANTTGYDINKIKYKWSISDNLQNYLSLTNATAQTCTFTYINANKGFYDIKGQIICTVSQEGVSTVSSKSVDVSVIIIYDTHFLELSGGTNFAWDYDENKEYTIYAKSTYKSTVKYNDNPERNKYFSINPQSTGITILDGQNFHKLCTVNNNKQSTETAEQTSSIDVQSSYYCPDLSTITSSITLTRYAKPEVSSYVDEGSSWVESDNTARDVIVRSTVDNMEYISYEFNDNANKYFIIEGAPKQKTIGKGQQTIFKIKPNGTTISQEFKYGILNIKFKYKNNVITSKIDDLSITKTQVIDVTIGFDNGEEYHSEWWAWNDTGDTQRCTSVTGQTNPNSVGFTGCTVYGNDKVWNRNNNLEGSTWYYNDNRSSGVVGEFYPTGYNIKVNDEGFEENYVIKLKVKVNGTESNELRLTQEAPPYNEYNITATSITEGTNCVVITAGTVPCMKPIFKWNELATINKNGKEEAPYIIEPEDELGIKQVYRDDKNMTYFAGILQNKYYNTVEELDYVYTGISYEISGKTGELARKHVTIQNVKIKPYNSIYLYYNLGDKDKLTEKYLYTSKYNGTNGDVENGWTEKDDGQKGGDKKLKVYMRDYTYNTKIYKTLGLAFYDGTKDDCTYSGACGFDWSDSDSGKVETKVVFIYKKENGKWIECDLDTIPENKNFDIIEYYTSYNFNDGFGARMDYDYGYTKVNGLETIGHCTWPLDEVYILNGYREVAPTDTLTISGTGGTYTSVCDGSDKEQFNIQESYTHDSGRTFNLHITANTSDDEYPYVCNVTVQNKETTYDATTYLISSAMTTSDNFTVWFSKEDEKFYCLNGNDFLNGKFINGNTKVEGFDLLSYTFVAKYKEEGEGTEEGRLAQFTIQTDKWGYIMPMTSITGFYKDSRESIENIEIHRINIDMVKGSNHRNIIDERFKWSKYDQ